MPPAPTPVLAPALANLSGTASPGVDEGFFGQLASGFQSAYAIGSQKTDAQGNPTDPAAQVSSEVNKVNQAITAAGGTPIPTNPEELLRSLLTAAGADITNAQVQTLIVTVAPHLTALTDAQVQAMVANQAQLHPAPQAPGVADYNKNVTAYGFSGGFGDYTNSLYQSQLQGPPGGAERLAASKTLEHISTQDYVINPDNGAVLFKNGVIFDPGTGNLVFPQGDASVQGSGSWMHKVTTWSPDKVLEWRKTLGEQGYLSPTEALNGSPVVDSNFLTAISSYQNARYSNYGTPIAKTAVDLSQYGPQGNKIFDLAQIRGTIVSQVRSQYRTTFGQDPSSGELKAWTDFVIRTGMSLQGQGLDPSQATNEALSTFGNRAENSPQANYIQNSQDENTSLHDALSSAVAATASVTR